MQSTRPETAFMQYPNLRLGVLSLILIFRLLLISSHSLCCHLSSEPRVCVRRVEHIYKERLTIPVVNNVACRPVQNVRGSLAQRDPPSMNWFAIGIEPLLHFLDRRLSGILMSSLPTSGPCLQNGIKPEPLQERYKVIGYADDIKPSVSSMGEFTLINQAATLFERSSGCLLHRDPIPGKCRVLPLGRWRNILQQEDIRYPLMRLHDTLSCPCLEWS